MFRKIVSTNKKANVYLEKIRRKFEEKCNALAQIICMFPVSNIKKTYNFSIENPISDQTIERKDAYAIIDKILEGDRIPRFLKPYTELVKDLLQQRKMLQEINFDSLENQFYQNEDETPLDFDGRPIEDLVDALKSGSFFAPPDEIPSITHEKKYSKSTWDNFYI